MVSGDLTPMNPDVVIFMGSDSDWSVMARAAAVLEEFGVTHEAIVSSAHRTHDRTVRLAKRFTAPGSSSRARARPPTSRGPSRP